MQKGDVGRFDLRLNQQGIVQGNDLHDGLAGTDHAPQSVDEDVLDDAFDRRADIRAGHPVSTRRKVLHYGIEFEPPLVDLFQRPGPVLRHCLINAAFGLFGRPLHPRNAERERFHIAAHLNDCLLQAEIVQLGMNLLFHERLGDVALPFGDLEAALELPPAARHLVDFLFPLLVLILKQTQLDLHLVLLRPEYSQLIIDQLRCVPS